MTLGFVPTGAGVTLSRKILAARAPLRCMSKTLPFFPPTWALGRNAWVLPIINNMHGPVSRLDIVSRLGIFDGIEAIFCTGPLH